MTFIDFYLDKSKAGAKGLKAASPILDGPIESDTSRPLDSEEIQALAIRLDELDKVNQNIYIYIDTLIILYDMF